MTKAQKFHHKTYREYVVKHKARTEHICSECGTTIMRSEEYYADNFASSLGSRLIGNPNKFIGQQSWTSKKICEKCWGGKKLKVL